MERWWPTPTNCYLQQAHEQGMGQRTRGGTEEKIVGDFSLFGSYYLELIFPFLFFVPFPPCFRHLLRLIFVICIFVFSFFFLSCMCILFLTINNNNNTTSHCVSRFRGVWEDPDVSNLTSTGITARWEADSKRPTKREFVNTFPRRRILWKQLYKRTILGTHFKEQN